MPCILKVRISGIRDFNTFEKSELDSFKYIEVTLGEIKQRTKFNINRSTNNLNLSFRLEIADDSELQTNPLKIIIDDAENINNGYIQIDLSFFYFHDNLKLEGWFPLYDSLAGLKGELYCIIKWEFFEEKNPYNENSSDVLLLGTTFFPNNSPYYIEQIIDFANELKIVNDPEYDWKDLIRSNRNSNEARCDVIQNSFMQTRKLIGKKAKLLGGNAILGYQEHLNLEGSTTNKICIRITGTVVKLGIKNLNEINNININQNSTIKNILRNNEFFFENSMERNKDMKYNKRESLQPNASYNFVDVMLLTLDSLPDNIKYTYGGLVASKAVKILHPRLTEEQRDEWLLEIRDELKSNAKFLSCNVVLGYKEDAYIFSDVIVLFCYGTAINILPSFFYDERIISFINKDVPKLNMFKSNSNNSHKNVNCIYLHSASDENENNKVPCRVCKESFVPKIYISSAVIPQNLALIGNGFLISAFVIYPLKKHYGEYLASEISEILPFLELNLHKQIICKLLVNGFNSIFDYNLKLCFNQNYLFGYCYGTGMCTYGIYSDNKFLIKSNYKDNFYIRNKCIGALELKGIYDNINYRSFFCKNKSLISPVYLRGDIIYNNDLSKEKNNKQSYYHMNNKRSKENSGFYNSEINAINDIMIGYENEGGKKKVQRQKKYHQENDERDAYKRNNAKYEEDDNREGEKKDEQEEQIQLDEDWHSDRGANKNPSRDTYNKIINNNYFRLKEIYMKEESDLLNENNDKNKHGDFYNIKSDDLNNSNIGVRQRKRKKKKKEKIKAKRRKNKGYVYEVEDHLDNITLFNIYEDNIALYNYVFNLDVKNFLYKKGLLDNSYKMGNNNQLENKNKNNNNIIMNNLNAPCLINSVSSERIMNTEYQHGTQKCIDNIKNDINEKRYNDHDDHIINVEQENNISHVFNKKLFEKNIYNGSHPNEKRHSLQNDLPESNDKIVKSSSNNDYSFESTIRNEIDKLDNDDVDNNNTNKWNEIKKRKKKFKREKNKIINNSFQNQEAEDDKNNNNNDNNNDNHNDNNNENNNENNNDNNNENNNDINNDINNIHNNDNNYYNNDNINLYNEMTKKKCMLDNSYTKYFFYIFTLDMLPSIKFETFYEKNTDHKNFNENYKFYYNTDDDTDIINAIKKKNVKNKKKNGNIVIKNYINHNEYSYLEYNENKNYEINKKEKLLTENYEYDMYIKDNIHYNDYSEGDGKQTKKASSFLYNNNNNNKYKKEDNKTQIISYMDHVDNENGVKGLKKRNLFYNNSDQLYNFDVKDNDMIKYEKRQSKNFVEEEFINGNRKMENEDKHLKKHYDENDIKKKKRKKEKEEKQQKSKSKNTYLNNLSRSYIYLIKRINLFSENNNEVDIIYEKINKAFIDLYNIFIFYIFIHNLFPCCICSIRLHFSFISFDILEIMLTGHLIKVKNNNAINLELQNMNKSVQENLLKHFFKHLENYYIEKSELFNYTNMFSNNIDKVILKRKTKSDISQFGYMTKRRTSMMKSQRNIWTFLFTKIFHSPLFNFTSKIKNLFFKKNKNKNKIKNKNKNKNKKTQIQIQIQKELEKEKEKEKEKYKQKKNNNNNNNIKSPIHKNIDSKEIEKQNKKKNKLQLLLKKTDKKNVNPSQINNNINDSIFLFDQLKNYIILENRKIFFENHMENEFSSIIITPLNVLPHVIIKKYFGVISLHIVKENINLKKFDFFYQSLISDILFIAKSHIKNIGANLISSFKITNLFLREEKSHGYALISICGDVAKV
ncbi:hypothetical protein PFAG_00223 [Plasmodium falciparum Santa Lucia]|uniref:C2 domain-containing protein n=1 Tax=Plasmodium falciparum Santa Lucia TaxID=478859 RepID=W7G262_PLAFA|nr:hypothetical protein PFAG_00223 [Plasmodium falciparum Santa Lucia]